MLTHFDYRFSSKVTCMNKKGRHMISDHKTNQCWDFREHRDVVCMSHKQALPILSRCFCAFHAATLRFIQPSLRRMFF